MEVDFKVSPIVNDFDFVIVGGGSAGGWIARQLASANCGKVALIEAGPQSRNVRTIVPNWYPRTFGTKLDWNFATEPQIGLAGRRLPWPRGRLLGGSGAINAMIYLQAASSDFARWGWSWADMLATHPLLHHSRSSSPHPWTDAFISAAVEYGLQYHSNWPQSAPNSCGIFATAIRHGKRAHSAQGLAELENLHVLSNCQANRIEVQDRRAVAVHVEQSTGQVNRITARRSIVLCAGVIGTPQLLWQSGIGPSHALGELAIECQVDLPAVGKNLQDHLVFPVVFETEQRHGLPRISSKQDRRQFRLSGDGPLASNIAEAGALLASRRKPSDGLQSDLQIHFTPTHFLRYPKLASNDNCLSMTVTDLHPRSRGTLTFQAHKTDTYQSMRNEAPLHQCLQPVIDPQYLVHADDLPRLYEGVELAREIAGQPSLRKLLKSELLPGSRRQDCHSMERSIRSLSQSIYHPIGTCRMQIPSDSHCENSDSHCESSVVDSELRVHGVSGLRIADASVIPDLPSGNTNATTLLIAARLCQMLETGA